MSKIHNNITEAAHGGYAKSYNRITSVYYWPRMSRDIKKYVGNCDICQKTKPRRHAPVGMLQPIPIPSQPFEVVTMDFIPELPECEGYDNVLVISSLNTPYSFPLLPLLLKEKPPNSFFNMLFPNMVYPNRLFPTEILSGKEIFGRKFVIKWE
jgi:Integrase zinc binding domain